MEHFQDFSAEEQLYQLKFQLDKSALDVLRMLPDHERKTIDCAVTALKKHFKPTNIEEQRGLEFHQRAKRGDEMIEQLGVSTYLEARPSPLLLGRTLTVCSNVGFMRHSL